MPTIRIRQAEKSLDGSIRGITNTGEAPSSGKVVDKNEPFTIIYVVMDTRGPASLKASMVPILIDGIKHDYLSDNSIFDYMAEDIESVEVLAPFETHMYMVKAITQVVSIKTRKLGPKAPKDAKGTRSWPSGLSPFATEFSNDIKAPDKPGNYNLIIDIVTDDGRVKTITHPITVINSGE